MIKWKYKFAPQKLNGEFLTGVDVQDLLRELGDQGWELCAIDYGCFILKKPVETPP